MTTRRAALGGLLAASASLALPIGGCAAPIDPRRWGSRDPFTLGVASGEPRADGFVAWTRLAPDPMNEDPRSPGGMQGGDVPVVLEIARDDAMRDIVRRIDATAEARYAWSVHAEVEGLEPDRSWFYRFVSADATSPVGRARTAPAPDAPNDTFRFGFASCSNYEHGYFSAYRHLADDAPDVVLFLGDYIYEGAARSGTDHVRAHSGGKAARSLSDYRLRHSQYKRDDDLRRLHALTTSIAVWDDHEVQNDYADQWSETFDPPDQFLRRRAAAYQAFYENMPVRPSRDTPRGATLRVYDRYRFGRLLEVSMLDGRQYRSREACYTPPRHGGGHLETDADCPERLEPGRTMLGEAQERWLAGGFARADARWNLIGQDVLMAHLNQRNASNELAHWTDDWNGYPAARDRLLRAIQSSRLPNPVVLSGDIHSFWANDLKLGPDDDTRAPIVATEFVGTSISSHPPPHDVFVKYVAESPQVRFFDARKRGYALATVRADRLEVDFRAVSDARDPQATVSTLARFAVESGRPGVQPA